MKIRSWWFWVFLFVLLDGMQAKPLVRSMLKELTEHIKPRTLYIQNRSCVELGQKNIFCFIDKDDGGNHGQSLEVDPHLEDLDRTSSNDASFSEDYIDMGFTRKGEEHPQLLPYNNIIEIFLNNKREDDKKSRKFFDLNRRSYSDSSDEESEEESREEESREEEVKMKRKKPKRYEVVKNSDEDSKSSSSESRSDGKTRQKGRTRVIYAQSPTRHLSVLNRRRLPHFLPKRYHWSLNDIQHLPYLWFNGPQGQHAGIFRITS